MSRKTKAKKKTAAKREVKSGWLSTLRKKISTITIVSFFLSFTFVLIFIFLFTYLKGSASAKIGGNITQFKDIELSYETDQSEGISPLCGCMAEKKAEEWRGISFVARHIQINRTGDSAITGYVITNPLPATTSWMPQLFKLRATIYSIALPRTEIFDPGLLLLNKLPESNIILESRDIGVKNFLMLYTERPLNVSLLGKTPLGAWVPAKGSRVSLKYEKGMHADSDSLETASIEEMYSEYSKDDIQEKDQRIKLSEEVNYPIGDFLGPDVILWSGDKSAFVTAEKETFRPTQSEDQNSKRVTAIVIKSAFSVRVACEPFEKDELDVYLKDLDSRSGNLFIPRRVRDSGKVVVSIFEPRRQASEFNDIYRFMKANPVTWVKTPHGNNDGTNNFSEEEWNFRYPPLPPNAGFNIFGPINNLTLTSALGTMMIGSRQFPITAPSSLKLENIQSLKVAGDVISVPIQLDMGKNQASLELEATSEVYVNDESLNKKSDQHKDVSDYLLLTSPIISILSLLVGLGSLLMNKST